MELFVREKNGIVVSLPLLNLVVERGKDFTIPTIESTSISVGGLLTLLFVRSLTRVKNFESSDSP